jgi:hypothetical protein
MQSKLMNMKNHTLFATIRVFLLLAIAGSFNVTFGQTATKEVFNSAVDQINCETIRFIHREQGRAEAANTMNCLSYEAIQKSIPEDEASSTGALCKKINEYKSKFKEDKPLEAQLNEVIKFAGGSITKKKRKGNVEDYKAKLESYKKDALANAGAAPKTTEKPAENTAAGNKPQASDTSHAITEPATSEQAKAGTKKTDWLGLLSLLVAIGGLALAYMAYSKVKKIEAMGPGSVNSMNAGNTSKEGVESAMREIKRLENKLNTDIAEIHRKIEAHSISRDTAINPKSAPEKAAGAEIVSNFMQVPPQTDATPEPTKIIPVVEPPKNKEPEIAIPESHQPHNESVISSMAASVPEMGATVVEEVPAPATDLFAGPTAHPEHVQSPQPSRGTAVEEEKEIAVEEPFMPEKEYEDGEAVPFYMYAGLPDADGNFELNSFTSDPVKDSVYEIEMYEDVPDKAFFSLLPNPEVIRKALMEPEIYLAPCCSYAGDPAGKRTIILAEEGMLRKQDDKWTIYEKAKITFE